MLNTRKFSSIFFCTVLGEASVVKSLYSEQGVEPALLRRTQKLLSYRTMFLATNSMYVGTYLHRLKKSLIPLKPPVVVFVFKRY